MSFSFMKHITDMILQNEKKKQLVKLLVHYYYQEQY